MNAKLIILDRDGVINLDSDDYIKSMDEWQPIPSSLTAIARLNRAGFKVAVATNQSGVSRGYFNHATLALIHKKMELALAQVGGHLDALEYCPDHPDQATIYRKPNPGMALKLLERFDALAGETWLVGDSLSDIECALNAGCKPALVLTGKGERTLKKLTSGHSVAVFEDLAAFVSHVLQGQPGC